MKKLIFMLAFALSVAGCDCNPDTRRYTFCAGGPVSPEEAPVGAWEVWIGDGDITCWRDGAPQKFRTMRADETPDSACVFCEEPTQ